jgi:ribosomal protein L33
MAKKGNRTWVWMIAKIKGETNYRFQTERNKVNLAGEKLEIKRYDPTTRKQVVFKESK